MTPLIAPEAPTMGTALAGSVATWASVAAAPQAR